MSKRSPQDPYMLPRLHYQRQLPVPSPSRSDPGAGSKIPDSPESPPAYEGKQLPHRRRRSSSEEHIEAKRLDRGSISQSTAKDSDFSARSENEEVGIISSSSSSSSSASSRVSTNPSLAQSTGYKDLPGSPPTTAAPRASQSSSFAAVLASPRPASASPRPATAPAASTPVHEVAATATQKGYPPLVVEHLPDWPKHFKAINDQLGHPPNARPFGREGMRFFPQGPEEHRALQRYLTQASHLNPAITWHSYTVAEELPTKIAIRGLPPSTPLEDIKHALEEKGFSITHLRNIPGKMGRPGTLFYVSLDRPNENDLARLFKITELMFMTGIVIEGWKGGNAVPQCHRCQAFGHSSLRCYRPPKCIRCGEGHTVAECPRPRDAQPTCANCGKGHAANYRNCTVFKQEARRRGVKIPPPLPAVEVIDRPPRPTRADRRAAQRPTQDLPQERPLPIGRPPESTAAAVIRTAANDFAPRRKVPTKRRGWKRTRNQNLQGTLEDHTHPGKPSESIIVPGGAPQGVPQNQCLPTASRHRREPQLAMSERDRDIGRLCTRCGKAPPTDPRRPPYSTTGQVISSHMTPFSAPPTMQPTDEQYPREQREDLALVLIRALAELLTALAEGNDPRIAAKRGLDQINSIAAGEIISQEMSTRRTDDPPSRPADYMLVKAAAQDTPTHHCHTHSDKEIIPKIQSSTIERAAAKGQHRSAASGRSAASVLAPARPSAATAPPSGSAPHQR